MRRLAYRNRYRERGERKVVKRCVRVTRSEHYSSPFALAKTRAMPCSCCVGCALLLFILFLQLHLHIVLVLVLV